MAVINFARREIEAKVVYYGPAFSGKTTNVRVLHALVPSPQRGDLHTLATAEDRTLFFDYVPIQLGQIAGFSAKFKLFTVPGQIVYHDTRKVVLQGADAVVFVADSTPDRADANLDSLVELEENLRANGLDLASIPIVIQLNKRDVPGARPVANMVADLNPFGVPVIEAMAEQGKGVLDTLRQVTEIAAQRIRENLGGHQTAVKLTAVERSEAEDDRRIIKDHLDRIRKVRPAEEERERQMRSASRIHVEAVDAFLSANVERAAGTTPRPPGADRATPRPANERPAAERSGADRATPRPAQDRPAADRPGTDRATPRPAEPRAGGPTRHETPRPETPRHVDTRPRDGADRSSLRPPEPPRHIDTRPRDGADRNSLRPADAAASRPADSRPRDGADRNSLRPEAPQRPASSIPPKPSNPASSPPPGSPGHAEAEAARGARPAAARPKTTAEGPPLLAIFSEEHGTPKEILGGLVGPDGRVRVEVVLERGGQSRRHTVTLAPGEPTTPRARATLLAGVVGLFAGALLGGVCGGLMTTWLNSP